MVSKSLTWTLGLVLALGAATLSTSCGSDDDGTEGAPTLTVSPNPVAMPVDDPNEAVPVTITSNRSWTITIPPADTWLTVSQTSGSGNKVVTFKAGTYTGTGVRTSTVKFAIDTKTVNVNFTQSAIPVGGLTSFYEDWRDVTLNQPLNNLNGWTTFNVAGGTGNFWIGGTHNDEKFIKATSYISDNDCEAWLISPALDITGAANKTLEFETQVGYQVTVSGVTPTSLEVYLLDTSLPTGNKTKLTANIPQTPPSSGFTDWASSGVIDLSSYSGTKYIGFRFVSAGGQNTQGRTSTFQMDNFNFGDATPPAVLEVDPPTMTIDGAGTAQTATVTASAGLSWTASANEAWCIITNGSGTGNGTFSVSCAANGGGQRTATVTVSATGVTPVTIGVTQLAQGVSEVVVIDADLTTFSGTSISAPVTFGDGSILARIPATDTFNYTVSSNSIYTNGWDAAGAAWVITSSAVSGNIAGNIKVEMNAWGTGTSPKNWKVQYSNDGTTYNDATGATYTLASDQVVQASWPGTTLNFTIPTDKKVNSGGKLYIKLLPSDQVSIGNATVASGGNSRLGARIKVTAIQ